ncbi:MAG TPA: NGG1p interacting factor NIF3 [Gammaproteobacteria bacterium]|nr:NGG1p interacting factor NIF3 [Gammaproteobacteria bacterium]
MYKICFYVPETHTEEVKKAMFAAGGGKLGLYSCCAWQALGEGQFMPLEGSHAFIGEENRLEKVSEYKVEMVCEDNLIQEVVKALKQAHPYEEPAYQVWRLEEF